MTAQIEQDIKLRPVLAMRGYAVELPHDSGKSTYRFHVKSGEIEIHHHSYDGIIGLWCLPPISGDAERQVLRSGEDAEITFDSRIHDSEPDYIEIANRHYGKQAEFTFSKVEQPA